MEPGDEHTHVSDSIAGRFWRYISSSLERLVQVGTSLDAEGLVWHPPAPEANSVSVLVRHTLGNAEENVLHVLCGENVGRARLTEFTADPLTADAIEDSWIDLRPRLERCLASLDDEAISMAFDHPRRGTILGLDVLIVVARHAAEHLGQAELTRDLWLATREAHSAIKTQPNAF